MLQSITEVLFLKDIFVKILGKSKQFLSEAMRDIAPAYISNRLPNNSLQRLNELKGTRKGKRCFIIGNGPSLNNMDLNRIANEYVFLFNGAFDLRKYFNEEKIFHVAEDQLVIEDHQIALNDLRGLVFLPSDLSQLVKSETPIVVEFRRGFPEWSKNWPPFVDLSSEFPKFYWGGTVAYLGLQLAAWMGFDEVYFIGMDLSYSIPDTVIKKGAVLMSTDEDPNHYNKGYFGPGLRWHVPQPERMGLAFQRASERNLPLKIFNASVGGNLNCFERIDFEALGAYDESI